MSKSSKKEIINEKRMKKNRPIQNMLVKKILTCFGKREREKKNVRELKTMKYIGSDNSCKYIFKIFDS